MTLASALAVTFDRWIENVAAFALHLLSRFVRRHDITLREEANGEFVVRPDVQDVDADGAGQRVRISGSDFIATDPNRLHELLSDSRVTVVLQPSRFLFQPLELPRRASDFLEGIVRTQLDQLTPWTAAEAAFGWSNPTEIPPDRIVLTVAAAPSSSIDPYAQALSRAGAYSISLFTSPNEGDRQCPPIKVLEVLGTGGRHLDRTRQALRFGFVGCGIAAVISYALSTFICARLDAQHEDYTHRITTARTTAFALREAASGSSAGALRSIVARKHDNPSVVAILDVLSQILPDHTYLTELRIEGGKIRVIGVTRDAPSLIALLEQSGHFGRATFFAPTTRSDGEPGERFHIESAIQPFTVAHS